MLRARCFYILENGICRSPQHIINTGFVKLYDWETERAMYALARDLAHRLIWSENPAPVPKDEYMWTSLLRTRDEILNELRRVKVSTGQYTRIWIVNLSHAFI